MTSCLELPEGYSEYYMLDMQKQKKPMLIINGTAIAAMVILYFIGTIFHPIDELFSSQFLAKFAVMAVGYVLYMVLHELVHGITMKHFGSKKIKYGFTGMYAFAGCDEYFAKKPYIIIAFAPIVVWGIVLLVVNLLVPEGWFWVVYFIQIGNISGAAGDMYVSIKFGRMPKDILIKDAGVSMTVYSKEAADKK